MDNAPVHSSDEYSHIQIVKFPPNTTSETQPLDAGIIKNMKLYIKKQFLKYMLVSYEEKNLTADAAAKGVTIGLAVEWLKKSI